MKKGISKTVVDEMLDNEKKVYEMVDRLFSGGDFEHLNNCIHKLQSKNDKLADSLTVGVTKHRKEYNKIIIQALLRECYDWSVERLYSAIQTLTEEELI